ncbi:NAD(P)-binding protein [Dichomitus squalens]|uniref:NAD(P)-binding protein n=1 Tax=Dichomitus squalens TaxID=114155 RepID=A0A4V6MVY5_9APHY|nr:NAD(P)-binding protein [Dichomitus squalens]
MDGVTASSPRVAIVTGAAQGLGEAIALRLADDDFDVAVVGSTRNPERLDAVVAAITAKGRRAIAVTGDVSLEADIVSLVEKTVRELGGVDVMVANAAIVRQTSLVDLTVEEWDEHLGVNARGVMLCFKHAARQMIRQGRGGRIIAIGSTSSKRGHTSISAYAASKFAIRGLAQCAALELRKYNITVNTVAPGSIATKMMVHPDDEVNGGPCSTMHKTLQIPVDTPVGQPSDVAALVSYVARPESGFLTGQCIGINGGYLLD